MNSKETINMINKDFSHPIAEDENIQNKIYQKREFHYYRIPDGVELTNEKDIKENIQEKCSGKIELQDHQKMLCNFINPDTPYTGLLLFHGIGSGKCVDGSTLVYVNDELKRIDSLWDHTINYKKNIFHLSFYDENEEWQLITSETSTLSFDGNKIIRCNIDKIYRQYINENIREIVLANGSNIICTLQHCFYVNDFWSNNININDYVLYYKNNVIQKERVSNINYYNYNGYVFDLEINKYHNYIANNIITHNTCAAISIAEKFKEQVTRYNTKIYVLVSGPLLKEQWKKEIIKCTSNTYLSNNIMDANMDKDKQNKNAIMTALQYYKFMSYKSFYKRVLGEKIYFKKGDKKNYERDVSANKIVSLNNTLLIVEEAHNLTGNEYGDALRHLLDNSINLKILLLTATPMKNLADDIIYLINFLRPKNSYIDREKVFTVDRNHEMKLKPNGIEYLKNMCSGYVSYIRGGDPLLYATKTDIGTITKNMMFTKIIPCNMKPFQYQAYKNTIDSHKDSLDRKSEAVANFVFPGIDKNGDVVGYYGIDGRNKVINQLKSNKKQITKKVCELLNIPHDDEIVYLANDEKRIVGNFLKEEYLSFFSIKFYTCLKNIKELVKDKKGARTSFVYSNLVRIGVDLFQDILLKNGFLEFNEFKNYSVNDDTLCYFCGHIHKNHDATDHTFYPATFILVTGKSDESGENVIPEEKQRILENVFNNFENKNGKYIKVVIGSKVMNEGISLKNVAEVHILDVYYNLGRIEQVTGRAIRHCSHSSIMLNENLYQEVKIYKYCITLDNELSTEEALYKKAELKFLCIKNVERALKEIAIDCPLNMNSNINKNNIKKYTKCVEPGNAGIMCPDVCDFTSCYYKCHDKVLNNNYYDPDRFLYKKIDKSKLDYSTFTGSLARNEIDATKEIIKKIYKIKHVYKLRDIIKYTKKMSDRNKIDLYDDFFVFKALDELIPVSVNEINNFKDYIYDKYDTMGYIMCVKDYYIFQPVDQPKDLSLYYRTIFNKQLSTTLLLSDYIRGKYIVNDDIVSNDHKKSNNDDVYDMEYYNSRPEFDIVGIIEFYKNKENFKIRNILSKNLEKKRASGIPSFTGAVCTTKDKSFVKKIAKKLNIDVKQGEKRKDVCGKIKEKLMDLEKLSKGKNKKTYMMIPNNHPIYSHPYNLEDRFDYVSRILKENDIEFKTTTTNNSYSIDIKCSKKNEDFVKSNFKNFDVITNKSKLIIKIE